MSTASHKFFFIGCKSLEYPVDSLKVPIADSISRPLVFPALALIISRTSGFFFCGITLLISQYLSGNLINRYSYVEKSIRSSAILLSFVIISVTVDNTSITKSLLDTASMLFSMIPSKPNISAVYSLSILILVPTRAHAPRELKFTLS